MMFSKLMLMAVAAVDPNPSDMLDGLKQMADQNKNKVDQNKNKVDQNKNKVDQNKVDQNKVDQVDQNKPVFKLPVLQKPTDHFDFDKWLPTIENGWFFSNKGPKKVKDLNVKELEVILDKMFARAEKHGGFSDMDPYNALGVDKGASDDVINQAFEERMKQKKKSEQFWAFSRRVLTDPKLKEKLDSWKMEVEWKLIAAEKKDINAEINDKVERVEGDDDDNTKDNKNNKDKNASGAWQLSAILPLLMLCTVY